MKSNENPIPDDRIDNPFEYTRPLVNKGKLVPRNDTVRDITNALRRESVVSVMGSWQTGKTGLLLALREQFDRTAYVDFDTESHGEFRQVLSNVQHSIERQGSDTLGDIAGDGNDTRALVKLFDALGETASIVFLIDALPMPREIACRFLAAIRAYCMEGMAERGPLCQDSCPVD